MKDGLYAAIDHKNYEIVKYFMEYGKTAAEDHKGL